MAKRKIKTGNVEVPDLDAEFDERNMTAHISLRLPLMLLNDLRRLALNPKHKGRYQVLMKDVLQSYADKQSGTKKKKKVTA